VQAVLGRDGEDPVEVPHTPLRIVDQRVARTALLALQA
jgi:hypothetical protein